MVKAVNERILAALYAAFHGGKKSPKQTAEALSVSYSYLARAVLAGDSGCNFPVLWLVPFVQITGNHTVVKVIVNACGFLMVRNPRVSRSVKEMRHGVHRFQQRFCEVIQLLIQFLNEPTGRNRDAVLDSLVCHQEEAEYWKRMVRAGDVGQLELAFERGS